jgi:hypothetical protein
MDPSRVRRLTRRIEETVRMMKDPLAAAGAVRA